MAAKKKASVNVDPKAVKKLMDATDSLSELANALATGVDDPVLQARAKKSSAAKSKK